MHLWTTAELKRQTEISHNNSSYYLHLCDCQLAGVDKHNWKRAMWTSIKERKREKEDITRRYMNRERRTYRQIWKILYGVNIHFNKGNESRCFILKGPNSLNHWNKENEAFIHKYTSKGKGARASGLLVNTSLALVFYFYIKESKTNP